MRETIEEYYEKAMKGYDHPSLAELCERDPALRRLVFEAELFEQMQAYFSPESADEEKPLFSGNL